MFGGNRSKAENGPAHTLISRRTELAGDIHFAGELIVEGKVVGCIYADDSSESLIRIADGGVVEGEICVPSVIVNGTVKGDIRSCAHVELAAKGVVMGDVYYKLIEIVMGAEVNGSLVHREPEAPQARQLGNGRKILAHEPVEPTSSISKLSERSVEVQ